MELKCAVVRAESGRAFHFRDNNPRRKPFRFSPAGLPMFSELEGYLRIESSAENLGNHFLASLSFFGVLTTEENILQPVACESRRGIWGTSGVGASIGTSDGDGAVDGRLRIGRGGFGEVLMLCTLSGVLVTL